MWLNIAAKEISMKFVEDDDCSIGINPIDNNNYKMTRDDGKVAEAERCVGCQDSEDVETQSEIKASVEETEKNEDETSAENLSTQSTVTPNDPALASSMTSAPRPLIFSIDRIMATANDDVGGNREAATSDEVIRSEDSRRETARAAGQRENVRHWTESERSTAAAVAAAAAVRRQMFEGELRNRGAAGWLSRLQQETSELQLLVTTRHPQQAILPDWRSSSSLSTLINRVSPVLLYRHLQASLTSQWIDAARYVSPGTSSSRSSQHSRLQPAMTPPGRPAWRPASERRYPVYMPYPGPSSRMTAGKLDGGDGCRQNLTAADWSSRNKVFPETAKYAASGALDLSRRSTADHLPQSTRDTSAAEMTSSDNDNAEQKQPDAKMWLPVVDLKNSLENIVNQDVEKPVKQISCPVCGKKFNAHYNLTRHMPVHTGARPFICKV